MDLFSETHTHSLLLCGNRQFTEEVAQMTRCVFGSERRWDKRECEMLLPFYLEDGQLYYGSPASPVETLNLGHQQLLFWGCVSCVLQLLRPLHALKQSLVLFCSFFGSSPKSIPDCRDTQIAGQAGRPAGNRITSQTYWYIDIYICMYIPWEGVTLAVVFFNPSVPHPHPHPHPLPPNVAWQL